MKYLMSVLWSQTQNIEINVFRNLVQYRIPIYTEWKMLGQVKNIRIENKVLFVEFENQIPQETTDKIDGIKNRLKEF
jgi:hypothetical protein